MFYNDSISPVTKMAIGRVKDAFKFYNDSISPVTKINWDLSFNHFKFYNDSISPVTKIHPTFRLQVSKVLQ